MRNIAENEEGLVTDAFAMNVRVPEGCEWSTDNSRCNEACDRVGGDDDEDNDGTDPHYSAREDPQVEDEDRQLRKSDGEIPDRIDCPHRHEDGLKSIWAMAELYECKCMPTDVSDLCRNFRLVSVAMHGSPLWNETDQYPLHRYQD